MKKLILAVFLTTAFFGCKTNKEQPPQPTSSEWLSDYYIDSGLPAVVMGHVKPDGSFEWQSFGPSIWDGTDSISEDHIFRIFSMTKAIASVAALQLVEAGKIGLDDPLNDLMPEMAVIPILTAEGELYTSDATITLRQLLTHTAGFGYDFTSTRLAGFRPEKWDYEDQPRLFEPGERWHYGTNTDWVGKLVEKVTEQSLEDYFRQNITGPLEMERTWFNVPDSLQQYIVSWGVRDSTGFVENQRVPQRATSYSAGGGLHASPKDYLRFLKCLLNNGQFEGGHILKPESVQMLFTNQLPQGMSLNYDLPEEGLPDSVGRFPDEKDVYGLAWALENNADETVRTKGAAYWAGIANSYYTIDPETDIAIVYFTQFLPFNDKESYEFYKLYEKQVYASHADKE
ncbi:serine hydrolase domain-containing protein [Robiginitalea sp. IMCC43444]|uniref:serine hydrolase domain-containing protein n=1 Tax=Robiginitalea sp. IMCC43444 TaxID=3459121 RepID=UPI0040435C45